MRYPCLADNQHLLLLIPLAQLFSLLSFSLSLSFQQHSKTNYFKIFLNFDFTNNIISMCTTIIIIIIVIIIILKLILSYV